MAEKLNQDGLSGWYICFAIGFFGIVIGKEVKQKPVEIHFLLAGQALISQTASMRFLFFTVSLVSPFILAAADAPYALTEEQQKVPLEATAADPSLAKIVLVAGTPSNKPGQHEYFAGCALLRQWLAELPGVAPVMVSHGWPQDETVFDGAQSVLFFLDGGEKLTFLTPERLAKMEALAAAGTGLIMLHQAIDCPPAQVPQFKRWFGAAFQSDSGCRGHWDVSFAAIPTHPVTTGLQPFDLLKDGWLYNLHFAETGVTPLLTCKMPVSSRKTEDAKAHPDRDEAVAWAYERADGGRSVGFTGCDLHSNWAEPNQRRLLLNAILWTAKQPVPEGGAVSVVSDEQLTQNWDRKLFQKRPAPAASKQQ